MTKAEILQALQLLPLGRLEKLYKYSQNIIIPSDDLLVNATMSQMLDKSMELADEHFPEWTDRSESDFGKFLVELMCLFSEKDFYYINAFANESFLSKMSLYSDIFTKSIELGYSPILTNSSEATFNVTFEPGNAFTYPRGSLILEFESKGYKFTNLAPFTVPASGSALVLSLILREGEILTDTQSFNGYRVPIRKTNISVEDITVSINNQQWNRVRVFGQSDSTSKHFTVLPEVDGSANIYFGEDGFGLKPELNSTIKLSYLRCNGSTPNGIVDTIKVNKYSPSRKIGSVVMATPPSKGSDTEKGTSIVQNTMNYFSTKFTVNNDAAVERWLNSQDEIHTSKALIQGSVVYFRVQPNDGTIANASLLTDLENRIKPFISGGYDPQGLPTFYVNVAPFDIELYYLTGYDENNLISLVKSLVIDYSNPLVLGDYGKGIDLSELAFLIKSTVKGVQNVVFNTPANDISINLYELLETLTLTDINVTAYEV